MILHCRAHGPGRYMLQLGKQLVKRERRHVCKDMQRELHSRTEGRKNREASERSSRGADRSMDRHRLH